MHDFAPVLMPVSGSVLPSGFSSQHGVVGTHHSQWGQVHFLYPEHERAGTATLPFPLQKHTQHPELTGCRIPKDTGDCVHAAKPG